MYPPVIVGPPPPHPHPPPPAVYSGADQRKHQISASLAVVRGIHRWPANSPHKGPVTRKMVPLDDVIMGGGFRQLWLPDADNWCKMQIYFHLSLSLFGMNMVELCRLMSPYEYGRTFNLILWNNQCHLGMNAARLQFQGFNTKLKNYGRTAIELHDISDEYPYVCKRISSLLWRQKGRNNVSNHQPHDCLLKSLFRRRSKKTLQLRVTGLCVGISPGTGEFPAQMASDAENVSIWWRHCAWDMAGA